ncbi:hypothetical protein [Anaerobacillus alkaliphilus]|nr:hypothetical protein [Anaerobacillus alkaliphilus]
MNYVENLNLLFCETQEEISSFLDKFGYLGFEKMSNTIFDYINRSESNHYSKNNKQGTEGDLLDTQKPNKRKENNRWTAEQNSIFLDVIDDYRSKIHNKSKNEIKKITQDYAFKLKKQYEHLLNKRNQYSIAKRLAYFDELLAGVGTPDDYLIKDKAYFGIKNRYDNSTKENPARIGRNKK